MIENQKIIDQTKEEEGPPPKTDEEKMERQQSVESINYDSTRME